MLYGLVIVVHVAVCIFLVAVILLQAGRGGGLSESFGGGVTQSLFGTKANKVLTRATEVSAVLFIITCLLLGIMTSKRGRSLINLEQLLSQTQAQAGQEPWVKEKENTGIDETKKTLPKAQPENPPAE